MIRLITAFLLVLIATTAYILAGTGFWIQMDEIAPGQCQRVAGVPGAEDIAIDPVRGIAYLSSFNSDTAGIYTLDLTSPDTKPQLVYRREEGFLPLGLSLLDSTDPQRLFVVNRATSEIEWFDIVPAGLIPAGRTASPDLPYPNNVVALGPEEFYATSTHASAPNSVMRWLETLFRIGSGSVVHFANGSSQPVATDIPYANGIAFDQQTSTMYVGSISSWEVLVYERHADGTLTHTRSLPLPGGVDNLTITTEGILAALHPKAFEALAHLSGSSPTAPSRVVRFQPDRDSPVTTLLEDPGPLLSAAAVAATWRNQLLVGPVRDSHFLRCVMD